MAAEVKDRELLLSDIEEKLAGTREKRIREVVFVSTRGIAEDERIRQVIDREFAAGQNIHTFQLNQLARSILALAGEEARRQFLIRIGQELDTYSDTKHRLAWKQMLAQASTQS